MRYIRQYQEFKDFNKETNEGLKNWVTNFALLTTLGLVPPSIALSQSNKEKQEYVENIDQDKVDAALFIQYLNKYGLGKSLETAFDKFKQGNPNVKSKLDDINQYIHRDGKVFSIDQNYTVHDYSNVDINKFTPDNYLTDMGNMIEDSKEPEINNWIAEYERESTAEICIITVKNLADKDVADYGVEQGRRLGVGKKGADNGIVIVLSLEDRKWTIKTGYGMEGVLPDYTCSEIGQDMVPFFKQGDYYGGLMKALSEIKQHVGTDIEAKKEWMKKKKEADEKAWQEGWDKFLDILATLAIIGLIGGAIGYSYYKAKKKIKEMKEMKDFIDKCIEKIEDIKKEFPESVEILNSTSLKNHYDEVKSFLNNLPDTSKPSYNKEFETQIDSLQQGLIGLYNNYVEKVNTISKDIREIKNINVFKLDSLRKVRSGIDAFEEVGKFGYKIDRPSQESDITKYDDMITEFTELLSINVDDAISKFKYYKRNIQSALSKGEEAQSTLNQIKGSKSFVEDWERKIRSKQSSFDSYASGSEKESLKDKIRSFKSSLPTEDWLKLKSILSGILEFMDKVISNGEDEERRQRRRREEEEEERSRSYYSSSSSSSSSDSFGGFGGGSFGGGGSSGSW